MTQPEPDPTRGLVLLVEGRRTLRRRKRPGGGSNLAAMASLTPRQLLPGSAVDVIQLTDAADPQAVRSYLQQAAANDGPVLIYLTGCLMAGGKQRELHLGLRDSTSRNVRLTGLPWSWVVDTLAERQPHDTLVLVDLDTEPDVWQAVSARPERFGGPLPVWGTVNPPKSEELISSWTRTLATSLRRGFPRKGPQVQPIDVHREIARSAALSEGTVELVPTTCLPLANTLPGAQENAAADLTEPGEPVLEGPTCIFTGTTSVTVLNAAQPQQQPYAAELAEIRTAAGAGRIDDAIALVRQLTSEIRRRFGTDHPDLLAATETHAYLVHSAGRTAQAALLWVDIARMRARTSPLRFDEPLAHVAADTAHQLWYDLGPDPSAHRLGTEVIDLRERIRGVEQYSLTAAQKHQATLPTAATVTRSDGTTIDVPVAIAAIKATADCRRYDEALRDAAALAADLERQHGPRHSNTHRLTELQMILARQAGRLLEATEFAIALTRSRLASYGPDDDAVRLDADNAFSLWRAMGRTDDARRVGADIVALRHEVPRPAPGGGRPLNLDMGELAQKHLAGLRPQPTPLPADLPKQTNGVVPRPAAPTSAPRPAAPSPRTEPAPVSAPPSELGDIITGITTAQHANNHIEAVRLSSLLQRTVSRRHGPDHPDALAALDVHAHTTAIAGDTPAAVELYAELASRRSAAYGTAHTAVHEAAAAADVLWSQLTGDDADATGDTVVEMYQTLGDTTGIVRTERRLEEIRSGKHALATTEDDG